MDYEKKYNEALEWMRDIYPTMEGFVKEDAEHYFPELRESEDERIRKSLVDYFGRYNPKDKWDDEFSFKDVLSYLEKQKEQKQEWSENDKKGLDNCCAIIAMPDIFFDKIIRQKCLDFLYELPERFNLQPKPEWSDEDRNITEELYEYFRYLQLTSDKEFSPSLSIDEILDWLKSLRPSWKPSEEQMQCLLAVITNQYNAGAESCHLTLGSLYNDLKKLI